MRSPIAGAVVRSLRKALGIRQADLARQVGLSVPGLCRRERGVSPWRSGELERVAGALGIPARFLGVEPMPGTDTVEGPAAGQIGRDRSVR